MRSIRRSASANRVTGRQPDEGIRCVTFGELRRLLASIPAPDDEFAADLERIRAAQPALPIRAGAGAPSSE